jgi:hypothetical protein
MSKALLDLIEANPSLIAEYRRFLVKTMIDLEHADKPGSK